LDDVSEFPKKIRDIVISENFFLKASFLFDFDSRISRTFGEEIGFTKLQQLSDSLKRSSEGSDSY